jgi:hypothetical protein
VEAKLVCDLGSVHCILETISHVRLVDQGTYGQILLVGENQKHSISKFILVQHSLQLLSGLNNTVTIVAVNDEDDTLSVLEVMSPQRSDLILSSNIPHCELDVLVLNGLNVETWFSELVKV